MELAHTTRWRCADGVHAALAVLAPLGGEPGRRARHQAGSDGARQLVAQLAGAVHGFGSAHQVAGGRGQPPYLVPAQGWALSLAHAWPYVACAIGRGVRVGVDVEPEPAGAAPFEAALAAVALGPDEPAGDLVRRWTVKEAVLKAGGRGLTVDPRRVVTGSTPASLRAVPPGWGPEARWRLAARSWEGAAVTIAWRTADPLLPGAQQHLPLPLGAASPARAAVGTAG